ncbi:hypothetical protein SeMB42_g07097 [Synchytrium endobioticum]|uniref:Uncharacterized protein n=1 Tax=Synchytrium endobioticum TaxID=286115 RepID=A0A507CEQ6_9FUNG|nr:hypothetical protein SeMB42_g07097 [Synchytrium endobioticum]
MPRLTLSEQRVTPKWSDLSTHSPVYARKLSCNIPEPSLIALVGALCDWCSHDGENDSDMEALHCEFMLASEVRQGYASSL